MIHHQLRWFWNISATKDRFRVLIMLLIFLNDMQPKYTCNENIGSICLRTDLFQRRITSQNCLVCWLLRGQYGPKPIRSNQTVSSRWSSDWDVYQISLVAGDTPVLWIITEIVTAYPSVRNQKVCCLHYFKEWVESNKINLAFSY